MSKKSKLYRAQAEMCDSVKRYSLLEALGILKTIPHVKFDETVEVAFKLGVDPRQSDQNVRGAIPLPKGTGKKVKVAVIAADAAAQDASSAGADIVGYEDLIEKIKGGWLEFDVLIATPDAMPKIRALGRVLGPRGLMPNPKTGTVTEQTGNAVREARAGRVEFRNDKGACVHVPIGKVSFSPEDLKANCTAVINAILRAKPASARGVYVQSCTLSSTMSPGLKIDLKEINKVVS
ncbi:MAG: 50S ribosomal protein L1 [Lentisphaerae bacterium GWF2_45_14]|nr:MAG: 50S ribosomal protein L1 [Lentisphaerae bacterium GWF2_45_14]